MSSDRSSHYSCWYLHSCKLLYKFFTCILLVTVLCTDDSWRVTSQHNGVYLHPAGYSIVHWWFMESNQSTYGGRPTNCSYCVVCAREFGAVWNVQLLHPSLSFSLSSLSSQLGEASLPFGHPSMTASQLWSERNVNRTCGEGSRVFQVSDRISAVY